MKANLIAGCLSVATTLALAAPAFAEDSIYVPLFTYRTGPFAGSGTPIADGMHDYLTMLNERDGGIGGVKLAVDECETGYDTKKGLECYDTVKPKNPVIINPWSTGITLSLIPKAAVDKIPILSMAYGLSAAARGDVFPWVFNPPATYWDGAQKSSNISAAARSRRSGERPSATSISMPHSAARRCRSSSRYPSMPAST